MHLFFKNSRFSKSDLPISIFIFNHFRKNTLQYKFLPSSPPIPARAVASLSRRNTHQLWIFDNRESTDCLLHWLFSQDPRSAASSGLCSSASVSPYLLRLLNLRLQINPPLSTQIPYSKWCRPPWCRSPSCRSAAWSLPAAAPAFSI